MIDNQGQIIITATTARVEVFIRVVILYSLAYDAFDDMDDGKFTTALPFQIKVSVALIRLVRKPLIKPIVLAK